ncbi:hypothetical protein AKJ16_DCAP04899 [Drosera capensis]
MRLETTRGVLLLPNALVCGGLSCFVVVRCGILSLRLDSS